jgi:UDP-4-amino-4,6-dideoxy-N-acetyl-beta-L-altrosamine transaminase
MVLPYARQTISDGDVAAVEAALRDPYLTQGPAVEAFEAALAAAVGARFAVAVSSGTAALHAAYSAIGLGPGMTALTSPITFVATANAALYLGAKVRFADIDPETALVDPDAVDDAAEASVRLLVPVHFGGEVADLPALAAIAEARGWRIVEDAAHALGASYRTPDGHWHRVGGCAHSDMCCFSFHAVKQLTTGEGGAVTTNDPEIADRLRRFRSHGVTRDPAELSAPDGPWYYEQHALGYNYRITDFQCALGRSQLRRLSQLIECRRALSRRYAERLADLRPVVPLARPGWSRGAHHLFVVAVPADRRRSIYEELHRHGIQANVHYIPVYRQPYHRRLAPADVRLPGAERYYASALTLPLFPGMSETDVDRVVDVISAAVAGEVAGRCLP